jgi:oligoendopeptidase F
MSRRNALPRRDQLPEAMTWDLSDIYPNVATWERDFAFAATYPALLAVFSGRLGKSATVLLDALELTDECDQLLERLNFYAERLFHQDTQNGATLAMAMRVEELSDKISAARAYMRPELLNIAPEAIAEFIAVNPALEDYRHSLEKLQRELPHVLSTEVEEVLSTFGSVIEGARNIASTLANADLPQTFPRVPQPGGGLLKLHESQYSQLIDSANRKIRRTGWQSLLRSYAKFGRTFAGLYSHRISSDVKLARTRHYGSAIEMYMERQYVPVSVYDMLVDTVRAHLPLVQRYLRLKKRFLGLDRMHRYDLSAPLVKAGPRGTYEQAQADILEAVALLGPEYVGIMEDCFRNRRIDVLPNEGKYGGAYNTGLYGVHPRVLLNWKGGTRHGRSTLAHELGHYGNEWLCNAQAFSNYHYTIFNAEVASTMNELLLTRRDLVHATTASERVEILQAELDNFMGTIVRQTLFAEFERDAHALVESGLPLTQESLCEILLRLNNEYYGPAVFVDKLVRNEWARIPHFYNSFYVFSYATALSAAICIFNRMLTEGQPAVNNYLDFLSAGGKDYPLNLLRAGGADYATAAPVVDAFRYFENRLDTLEQALGQL